MNPAIRAHAKSVLGLTQRSAMADHVIKTAQAERLAGAEESAKRIEEGQVFRSAQHKERQFSVLGKAKEVQS